MVKQNEDFNSPADLEEIYKRLSQKDKDHADSLDEDERTNFLVLMGIRS